MQDWTTFSVSFKPLIEEALKRALDEAQLEPLLDEVVRYSMCSTTAKRLRPLLLLAVATELQLPLEQALQAIVALESIHVFSLIHDDLPGLDNDDLRRGMPTAHCAFDEGRAILAGDFLLNYAFEQLACLPNVPLLVRLYSQTTKEMIHGQVKDIKMKAETAGDFIEMYRQKTGALFGCATATPMVLLGHDHRPLLHFGEALGVAFQVIDDLQEEKQEPHTFLAVAGKEIAATVAQEKLQEAGTLTRNPQLLSLLSLLQQKLLEAI